MPSTTPKDLTPTTTTTATTTTGAPQRHPIGETSATPPLDPGLGNLSRLPLELRLCIYDWLPPYKLKYFGIPWLLSGKNPLAILRASRKLYEEVSHHVYHNIHLDFRIWPMIDGRWAYARIPELCKRHWKFRRPGSAVRRGFRHFPYHRTNVTIEVYPPSFNAEVVCLWQKINHLVDLLARARSRRSHLSTDLFMGATGFRMDKASTP
ncbi:hypothetical protein BJX62DRAFT_136173 [Aspergillus germanicus]